MKRFFIQNKKIFTIVLFVLVFCFTFIKDVPANMLGRIIKHYSHGYLVLYNPDGTFWSGEGLIAVANPRTKDLSPLLLIDWNVKLGLHKLIDITFNVENSPIGELYLDKTGVNLDKLDLSLSITQVSQLIDIINTLRLSGNLEIHAPHLSMGKKVNGVITAMINQVSSNIAPVNPLGSYQLQFNLANGDISVSSLANSNLQVNGSGNLQSLNLKCKVAPDKAEKMLEFLTVMGMPQGDGTYLMKVY